METNETPKRCHGCGTTERDVSEFGLCAPCWRVELLHLERLEQKKHYGRTDDDHYYVDFGYDG